MTTPANFDNSTLEAAIQRTREGNTDSFVLVVRQFEAPLRAWLASHAPPGIDVDEIAQRTFVAAFTRLDDYEPGTRFDAWLFAIARYQLKTEFTRLRRLADYHARYAPDLLQRELQKRGEEPPELFATRLDHLQACVDSLAEHLRRFVSWRYDEEIPLEEMAARSGRSVAAVKKQLWQIRQKLQQCIEARMMNAEGGAT
ncbi:sigma-70 family RNA polymerase sigma factor [Blastopirellula sp. JC732]|uniref:RNA polymerase sigma factor n=1 Tax=Blastopirellula sediminis TaxID=2894196 RepID=A0A9X1MS03_9BACT|nr:sigma-70 family RNA polymerase sigma factor [Blastopirellula sediminis]MCC9606157.1 sigma-70 family RNA polymerase sigma factor [Blastopirellula sediminis]MCC9630544.1 sigma-70 family RNA polymerase sigma factor [Blastopirellula sediminis]